MRFLAQVRRRRGPDAPTQRMSIVEEHGEERVRMANLAIVGSHSVNGVATLHTEILKSDLFRDFHELEPQKFSNKTNGITQRRWLLKSNPGLARLITDSIGSGWITRLEQLQRPGPPAADPDFPRARRSGQRENKLRVRATLPRPDPPPGAPPHHAARF